MSASRKGGPEHPRPGTPGRPFREVALPAGVPGALFLDEMPGRNGSLVDVWSAIAARQVSCIVCLADGTELEAKSPRYAIAVARGGVPCERIEHPIPDYGVPSDARPLRALAESIAARLRAGESVLVHCGAGIGRSGMFAICVLIALGLPLDGATTAVRRAGSGPENELQRGFVSAFAEGQTREAGGSGSPGTR